MLEKVIQIGEGNLDSLLVDEYDTGFESLNKYQLLKKAGELIVVGARPGMGKTAFMLQLGLNIANQAPVFCHSIEMSNQALQRRLLSGITGISLQRIRTGAANKKTLEAAWSTLKQYSFYIDDSTSVNINELINKTIEFNKETPIGLVMVDYLQLVISTKFKRNEQIAEISQGLRFLAKELNIPVLAASQVNRDCETRGRGQKSKNGGQGDYRPGLSDLAESSQIEKDGDVILFLSRHETYEPGVRVGEADFTIAKNRDGRVGNEVLWWDGSKNKFYEKESESESI